MGQSHRIVTVQETINGMSLAESDEYSSTKDAAGLVDNTARTISQDGAGSISSRVHKLQAQTSNPTSSNQQQNSPSKQAGGDRSMSSKRTAQGGML